MDTQTDGHRQTDTDTDRQTETDRQTDGRTDRKMLDLIFLVWLKDWSISGCGFEFYVKKCAYSQLETSGDLKFGRKTSNVKDLLSASRLPPFVRRPSAPLLKGSLYRGPYIGTPVIG